ncbi:hypothetical protein ACSSS7_005642 [Eimeria intestinalis]
MHAVLRSDDLVLSSDRLQQPLPLCCFSCCCCMQLLMQLHAAATEQQLRGKELSASLCSAMPRCGCCNQQHQHTRQHQQQQAAAAAAAAAEAYLLLQLRQQGINGVSSKGNTYPSAVLETPSLGLEERQQ